jgi:hypothetical protein
MNVRTAWVRVWDCAKGRADHGWCVQGEPGVAADGAAAAGARGVAGLRVAADGEFAFYTLTAAGRKQLRMEMADWKRRSGAIARLLEMEG